MVACLIDKETGSWDIDKVKGVFLPHEAEAILGMTISSRPVKDSVIWAWTTNGNFSMKGAYWVAQKWLKDQNHKADKGSTSDNTRFISIDCGIPEGSSYKDGATEINYTSDSTFTDTGVNGNIAPG
ncbi:putative lrr receptor-like serine/threonine-protein kinase [Quercus suber]|uniref:Lrr receptor-like serine/threonine-protein kinase n=1 Tax=Quercus suber TaxID=58331 RepID=A0AAW0KGR6_QUESU